MFEETCSYDCLQQSIVDNIFEDIFGLFTAEFMGENVLEYLFKELFAELNVLSDFFTWVFVAGWEERNVLWALFTDLYIH